MGWHRERLLISLMLVSITSAFAAGSVAAGPPLKLDIDKCVEMALEVNVSVLKADYELDIAKNGVITSASVLLPRVGFQSTNSKYEEAFTRQVGDKVILTDRAYSAALSIGETVTLDGVMGVFESLAGKRATEFYVAQVNQDVSYVAKQKYLMVLRTRKLLAVAEEALRWSKLGPQSGRMYCVPKLR